MARLFWGGLSIGGSLMKKLSVLLCCLSLSACVSFNDDHFDSVEDSLRGQMPDISLEKEMAIGLGSGLFNLVELIDDSDVDLSRINHVKVAIYQVSPRPGQERFNDAVFNAALHSQNARLSWERIVRVRQEDEQVWIFAGLNERRQILEALTVFVLEESELVLINMDGDLGELIDYALSAGNERRRRV